MIEAACAVIVREDRIFCAQRSEKMRHPLKWEFPGGKVEKHESPRACIVREIMEELRVHIEVQKSLTPTVFDYGNDYQVRLYPFVCRLVSGEPVLTEHKQYRWLRTDQLSDLVWLEGDIPVVQALLSASATGLILSE